MAMNLIDEIETEARHADHMAAMARYWMGRCKEAEQTLAVVVYAAGGVKVERGHLHDAPSIVMVREECPEDMTVRFRAKLQPKPVPA